MKLLIAADIFPPESGGPATYAVTLANELVKQGVEVAIVSLNSQSDKSVVHCSLFIVHFKNKLLRYLRYLWLLIKQAGKADVVYAMGSVNAGLPAWIAARLRGKKFVVKVVGDYAWEQGQVLGLVKDSIDDFQKKNYGGKISWLKKIEAKVARGADWVIVPSKYLAGLVKGWGADENKIQVVYNAVDFKAVDPVPHPHEERWLVSVGRLIPWKGMATLIELMPEILKECPDRVQLKIIGEGPEMEKLKSKIRNLKLESAVELLGNLSHEKTLAYIAGADLFVLNSGYEGLSHVALEALANGRPVLVSDRGGNRELGLVEENLFIYNNKEEIKNKIIRYFKTGVFNRGVAFADNRKEFFDQFKIDTMINKTRSVLAA